jgi:hypothetical protein
LAGFFLGPLFLGPLFLGCKINVGFRLTRSQRRRRIGVQPISSNVSVPAILNRPISTREEKGTQPTLFGTPLAPPVSSWIYGIRDKIKVLGTENCIRFLTRLRFPPGDKVACGFPNLAIIAQRDEAPS